MAPIKSWSRLLRLPNLVLLMVLQTLLRYGILEPLLYAEHPAAMSRWYDFILQVVATVCLAAGGYVINDYFDVKIDAVNKPEKNVVNRVISARGAIKLHLLLNLVALLVGSYLAYRVRSFTIALIFPFIAGLLWFYSLRYKRMLLLGNLLVALFASLVILLTWLGEYLWLSRNPELFATLLPKLRFITPLFFFYALFAFLVSLFREIIKDMEDFKGDEMHGCRTLPIVAGLSVSRWIVAALILATASFLGYVQWILLQRQWMVLLIYFLLAVQIPMLVLLVRLFRSFSREEFHLLSVLCKWIMFAGVMSIALLPKTL